MIEESVAFLVAQGKRVVYDAEHCFDGWRDDRRYALRCLRAAAEPAPRRSSCATRTAARCPARSPRRSRDLVARARRHGARVGIHCHNDAECGVANSLAAVEAGATHVQGTINGYGERCGNANLVTIIPNLQLKLGYECLPPERLATLTETAHYLDELLNRTPNADQPYVGKNAFAHKGGMHVAGVLADPTTFERMDPPSRLGRSYPPSLAANGMLQTGGTESVVRMLETDPTAQRAPDGAGGAGDEAEPERNGHRDEPEDEEEEEEKAVSPGATSR